MRSLRFVTPLVLGLSCVALPAVSHAQVAVGVSVAVAPPALPVYLQPPIPEPGYIWTPGYWAWGPDGYYWVPGTWVLPPAVGLYWTPGYWAWQNAAFVWIPGYWGPEVGFYGGIDYGFGYFGVGFVGGEWRNGHWWYNRGYNNFGHVHITDVFYHPVTVHASYVSFNGGAGGIALRPTPQQEAFARGQHTAPTALQLQHERAAAADRSFLASVNHGRPAVAATSAPGRFTGSGVVGARQAGAPYHPAATTAPRPLSAGPAQPGGAPHPSGATPAVAHPGPVAPHPAPAPAPHPAPVHAPAPAPHPEAAPHPEPHPAPHPTERKEEQH